VRSILSQALQVQTYLRLSRLDLARKQLQAMKSAEDDATLTQLTEAWVNIFLGGEKTQEAFYIFQELAEKHSVTVKLLNGKAVCHIHSGRFEEAEDLLMEALERNNSDEETLANLVVVGRHRGKADDVITRYIRWVVTDRSWSWMLRLTVTLGPLVQEQDRCEKLFADAAKNFAPSRS
jgi:coatomer protein complex subunit epsilon